MICNIKLEKLSLYIDGRFKGRRLEEITEHITKCDRCKGQIAKLRLLKSSLKNLTPVVESEGFDFEFNRRLRERLVRKKTAVSTPIQDIIVKVREGFSVPIPAGVKIAFSAASVLTVFLIFKMIMVSQMPVVEFIAGDVKIYNKVAGAWERPLINSRLKPATKIQTRDDAILNIVSKNNYKARIKGDSLIVISKLNTKWHRTETDFSISYGSLLVRTSKGFTGSKMRVYTPNCNAEVIGTAFIVNVSPKEKNITWLGVLEGRVAVIAKQHPLKKFKVERVFVYVSSGQKIETRPYSYPTPPELFSEGEWRMMQELYQLTDAEKIILLVGAGYDRVEELFRPAPLYVPQASRALPSRMRDMVDIIRKATEEGDITTVEKLTKTVEGFVEEHHNSEYDVEVLMFIASHYRYIKDYKNAIRVFEEVVKSYPNSHLTSLAQCAVATIYKDDLKDAQKAQEAYQQLISRYPGSIDAVRARDTLATIR